MIDSAGARLAMSACAFTCRERDQFPLAGKFLSEPRNGLADVVSCWLAGARPVLVFRKAARFAGLSITVCSSDEKRLFTFFIRPWWA